MRASEPRTQKPLRGGRSLGIGFRCLDHLQGDRRGIFGNRERRELQPPWLAGVCPQRFEATHGLRLSSRKETVKPKRTPSPSAGTYIEGAGPAGPGGTATFSME